MGSAEAPLTLSTSHTAPQAVHSCNTTSQLAQTARNVKSVQPMATRYIVEREKVRENSTLKNTISCQARIPTMKALPRNDFGHDQRSRFFSSLT